jgi:peptide/nickel transport system permease protein
MTFPQLVRFLAARLGVGLIVLAIVSTLVFTFVHIAPGGPEQALVEGSTATPEVIDAIRERYRLDEPIFAQYVHYLGQVATLDLGESYRTRETVTSIIGARLSTTVPLVSFGLLVTLALGTILGTVAAHRQRTAVDRSITAGSILFASAPPFALAIVLLYVFAERLDWFPVIGEWDGPLEMVRHLTLPAATLGLAGTAPMMMLVRTSMIEVLERDHVLFAHARGLSGWHVLFHHTLRNSLVAAITTAGVVLIGMLAAVAFVEIPFNLDGLGSYLVEAVLAQDVPVVQALTLLITATILVVNSLVDLLYAALDPRTQLGSR